MSPALQRPGWSWETRLCVVCFGLALAANLCLSSLGWDHTLLGPHQFRQLQTAVTAQSFLQQGISLDYETPLLGPPWQIPLEFPLFQAGVAGFVRLTGLELDPAGGVLSWLIFLTALPACYRLLARFRVPPAHRLLFLALLLVSPLYLYYSRCFLIESTALTLACWFLVCFDRFLARPHLAPLLAAALCGSLAGAVKVTTFVVFLVAALALLFGALRTAGPGQRLRLWLRAAAVVLAPMAVTILWVLRTSAIRHRNPEASFLDSHFGFWSFGDLPQRLSAEFWLKTWRVWTDSLVGESGLALIALYYCWLRGRYRWAVTGCLAVFLSGQLIFSNLYFVHDYYFYASGLFLVAALGFFLAEWLEQPALPGPARWAFVGLVLVLELSAYHRTYFSAQRDNLPPPPEVALLRAISAPEEVVVVIGHDWDAALPYYAQRRALMILQGRENDLPALRRTIERLDPQKVAAVLIQGPLWDQKDFVAQTMASLHLGPRPFFFRQGYALGLWVPESRQPALRDAFDAHRFSAFELAPDVNPTAGPRLLYARQIRQRAEFAGFHPRPIRAIALAEFAATSVDAEKVLFSHAPSELVFHPAPGARHITAQYGIDHGAYTGTNRTDGVEFVISERAADGTERELFRRFVEPLRTPADTGVQTLDLTLARPVTGELHFRTLIGPHHNGSFDWSFWGRVDIR